MAQATITSSPNNNTKTALPFLEKQILQHVLGAGIGTLTISFPSGHRQVIEKTPYPNVEWYIKTEEALKSIAFKGALGFGEAYVDGGWETPDLTTLLFYFLENVQDMEQGFKGTRSFFMNLLQDLGQKLLQFRHRNSRSGSKRNILAHYDLSNQFYQYWLDETMTYSSGIVDQDNLNEPLESQQERKYQRILDELNPNVGDHILEIGCGWGGFADYAATKGFKVTGITISDAQYDFAQKRLGNRANIILKDYRELSGRFDHVVSIEMIEAVGRQYWPTYFSKIKEVLKPGGRAVLQSILLDENFYDDYKNNIDFIQAHIFPGGFLPTSKALDEQADKAFLTPTNTYLFGTDYAHTLNRWQKAFQNRWLEIKQLDPKFNNRFKRLWEYYLSYCEAGFLNGRIDVAQVTFEHKPLA